MYKFFEKHKMLSVHILHKCTSILHNFGSRRELGMSSCEIDPKNSGLANTNLPPLSVPNLTVSVKKVDVLSCTQPDSLSTKADVLSCTQPDSLSKKGR